MHSMPEFWTSADVQQLPVPSDAVGGGVMAPPDVAANGAHDVEASNVLPTPAPAVAAVTDRAPAADVASGFC